MKLVLTPTQSYKRKQWLWQAYCKLERAVTMAFFPDTGGVPLLLHNWYACAPKSNPAGAKLAEWITDSTYARYRRALAKLEANDIEREHQFGNHRRGKNGFDPLWCPICNPKHAASYGLIQVNGRWQKKTVDA